MLLIITIYDGLICISKLIPRVEINQTDILMNLNVYVVYAIIVPPIFPHTHNFSACYSSAPAALCMRTHLIPYIPFASVHSRSEVLGN